MLNDLVIITLILILILVLGLGRMFRIFEPSFVCYAFEAKFLPSKLRCHTHFNVCTCALVQSKRVVNNVGVFQKSLGCVVGCFCLVSLSSDAKSE